MSGRRRQATDQIAERAKRRGGVATEPRGRAVLTGGAVISQEAGRTLEKFAPEDLGRAKRIEIDKDHTTLIGGAGEPGAIKARVAQIKRQAEDATSDYDRDKLKERAAKLGGGVALLQVGAATETEMKERKSRVEDALHATHAAMEEGVLPGGGVALLRARQEQSNVVPTIVSLRRHIEDIRQAELRRMRSQFGELTPEQEQALDSLTQGLVNKILHTPFTELKQAASRPDRSQFLDVVRTIFHLEDERHGRISLTIN